MRRNLLSAMAVLTALWGVPVRAQETQASMEAQEIQGQPIQLTSNWNEGNVAEGSMASACTDNSCCQEIDTCSSCCGKGGFVGGIEFLVFKAHLNSQNGAVGGGILAAGPTWDWAVAPRIWLGKENHDGLGVRVRYFQFDHESAGAGNVLGAVVTEGLKLDELDAELYQVGQIQRIGLQAGGGLRYGSLRRTPSIVGVTQAQFQFDGVGPTFFVNGYRDIGDSGFSLYAGARGSLLFGDHKFSDATGTLNGFRIQDQVVSILEVSMGTQWTSQDGRFFARGGIEAQTWHTGQDNSFLPIPLLVAIANSSDIGLVGTSLSIGVRR